MKASPLINIRMSGRWRVLLLLGTLLASNSMVLPVQAAGVVGNGTAASCTETAFADALAVGGNITFNCGAAPATIVFTFFKMVLTSATIDGGGLITLSGGNAVSLFQVFTGQHPHPEQYQLDARFRDLWSNSEYRQAHRQQQPDHK